MHSNQQKQTSQPVQALDGPQLSRLNKAIAGLSAEQISWASGYLAGMAVAPSHATQVDAAPTLTILYATQGGNARAVAEALSSLAAERGLAVRLVSADDYRPRDLQKERLLVVVISTQGEGEPPESSRELFRYLSGQRAPRLEKLRYAVFGLGDSSYEQYCQAGKELDRLLGGLGASAVLDRIDADVDYQDHTGDWYTRVLEQAKKLLPSEQARVIPMTRTSTLPVISRDRPTQAEVIDNRRITGDNAAASVHHLAMVVDPLTLAYQPGDALGVWLRNAPGLIDEILRRTRLSGDEVVEIRGETLSLYEALQSRLELTQLHPTVVTAWAEHVNSPKLKSLALQQDRLRNYSVTRQFVDLLISHPGEIDAAGLVKLLRPVQPRLYSIASSLAACEDELHLTVASLRYRASGREYQGGASGYLTRRLKEGDAASVYVAENPGFRLPASGDTPIIMVGAGTGIAPFRAFMQEREARGANGRNWLVFGNRNFSRDFLYQTDWLRYRKAGLLNRISLAFSRDERDRAYVQQRLREQGSDVYRWLQEGAHLYVCGGVAMEKEIRQSLKAVAKEHGGLKDEKASEFVENLREQNRYLRDVY